MKKNCKICNAEFETIQHGGSRKYCFICSPSYAKDDNAERSITITCIRRALKQELVRRKGGKCEICGYNKNTKALQFHHNDPTKKDFTIASISSSNNVNVDKAFEEIEKCSLLCANCHAELHDEIL